MSRNYAVIIYIHPSFPEEREIFFFFIFLIFLLEAILPSAT